MFYVYFPLILFFTLQGPLKFKESTTGTLLPKRVSIIRTFLKWGTKANLFNTLVFSKIKRMIRSKFKKKKTRKTVLLIAGVISWVFILLIIVLFTYLLLDDMYG